MVRSRRGRTIVEPNPMPWRTIDAASDAATTASTERPGGGPNRVALGAVGAAALVAVAAFLVAFGSGGSGAVALEGGGPIGAPSAVDASGLTGPTTSGSPGSADAPAELVVEVVGAVARPGVYHLPAGSRVGDLVDMAGGYGPRVDTDRASRSLNLAARLADGDQIRVPSRDEATTAGPASGPSSSPSTDRGSTTLTDLNRATAPELEALPGVGPATAAKIIAARDQAPFTTVDDLRNRKLVGAKTFDGLRELVTVR